MRPRGKAERKQTNCRQAIAPDIGHAKHDNRMIRCDLDGRIGEALHAIGCATGHNIRWVMWAIERLALKGLFCARVPCLCVI